MMLSEKACRMIYTSIAECHLHIVRKNVNSVYSLRIDTNVVKLFFKCTIGVTNMKFRIVFPCGRREENEIGVVYLGTQHIL